MPFLDRIVAARDEDDQIVLLLRDKVEPFLRILPGVALPVKNRLISLTEYPAEEITRGSYARECIVRDQSGICTSKEFLSAFKPGHPTVVGAHIHPLIAQFSEQFGPERAPAESGLDTSRLPRVFDRSIATLSASFAPS